MENRVENTYPIVTRIQRLGPLGELSQQEGGPGVGKSKN
jgi:hypothetical protein